MKTNFRQDFPILNDEANPVVYLDKIIAPYPFHR